MSGFHAALDRALKGDTQALMPWLTGSDAALAVYRNTTIKARIDALEANYPTVSALVGPDWFRAAAAAFTSDHPGADPAMAAYGAGFADWLSLFGPARELPYLGPMARLDRAWTEAHLAADAPVLDAEGAGGAAGAVMTGRLMPLHPSVRLFQFDWTAPSLWLAHHYPETGGEMLWQPQAEALLIHRPTDTVLARRLTPVEHRFLSACRSGRALGVAAVEALSLDSDADIPTLFAGLLNAGVFLSPNGA